MDGHMDKLRPQRAPALRAFPLVGGAETQTPGGAPHGASRFRSRHPLAATLSRLWHHTGRLQRFSEATALGSCPPSPGSTAPRAPPPAEMRNALLIAVLAAQALACAGEGAEGAAAAAI